MATERTWVENSWPWADGTSITPNTVKSRQFRGIGQQRYMMRDLDTSDVVNPSYAILPGTAVWTDYDGNWPTSDYTIDATGSPVAGTDYETGFAEVDPLGQVTYTHSDPIGTTRVITDDTGAPTTRPVYTAFGEPVFEDGAVGTRYRYAGTWGYEDFADQDWGTVDWDGNGPNNPVSLDFPYLHVGHRWYDPATGRFLQRDPIGIRGGLNVYAYVGGKPTRGIDPSGLFDWWEGAKWAGAGGITAATAIILGPPVGIAAGVVIIGVATASACVAGGLQPSDVDTIGDAIMEAAGSGHAGAFGVGTGDNNTFTGKW